MLLMYWIASLHSLFFCSFSFLSPGLGEAEGESETERDVVGERKRDAERERERDEQREDPITGGAGGDVRLWVVDWLLENWLPARQGRFGKGFADWTIIGGFGALLVDWFEKVRFCLCVFYIFSFGVICWCVSFLLEGIKDLVSTKSELKLFPIIKGHKGNVNKD
jgi:hypothetical protein